AAIDRERHGDAHGAHDIEQPADIGDRRHVGGSQRRIRDGRRRNRGGRRQLLARWSCGRGVGCRWSGGGGGGGGGRRSAPWGWGGGGRGCRLGRGSGVRVIFRECVRRGGDFGCGGA